ncbi:hypothetical protein C8J57DRAFT_1540824 [Mycena rebaudengoi]|nr:hypothetical protein C8J57DRAFT_1540824 [Mycena rebaudengoi]
MSGDQGWPLARFGHKGERQMPPAGFKFKIKPGAPKDRWGNPYVVFTAAGGKDVNSAIALDNADVAPPPRAPAGPSYRRRPRRHNQGTVVSDTSGILQAGVGQSSTATSWRTERDPLQNQPTVNEGESVTRPVEIVDVDAIEDIPARQTALPDLPVHTLDVQTATSVAVSMPTDTTQTPAARSQESSPASVSPALPIQPPPTPTASGSNPLLGSGSGSRTASDVPALAPPLTDDAHYAVGLPAPAPTAAMPVASVSNAILQPLPGIEAVARPSRHLCCICFDVLCNPVRTRRCDGGRGHTFCYMCLYASLQYSNLCPLCRTRITEKPFAALDLEDALVDLFPRRPWTTVNWTAAWLGINFSRT